MAATAHRARAGGIQIKLRARFELDATAASQEKLFILPTTGPSEPNGVKRLRVIKALIVRRGSDLFAIKR